MKQKAKFTSTEQQQQSAEQLSQQTSAREFSTAEELLRYDAAHTKVPPGIAQRLGQSAADISPPKRSWWQRLFGR